MALTIIPKRGRPKRHPVDELRTRLWFKVVKLRSGLPSAYAIEQAIEPREDSRSDGSKVWRPRKWDGYEAGRKVPARSGGTRDAVAAAESAYPGTAKWFDSPLWTMLKRQPFDRYFVEKAFRSLDQQVTEVLIASEPAGNPMYMRPRRLDRSHFETLAQIGSFDALVATVLLVQQSEFVGSAELRGWALDCYSALQPKIADAAETCDFYPHLFNWIDRVCQHWAPVAPNERLDVHVSWHDLARKTWAADRMEFIEQSFKSFPGPGDDFDAPVDLRDLGLSGSFVHREN